MEFYQGLLLISVVHLLAAASPGPDFVLVSQHSLSYGKRAGLWCSLGIALGLSIHIMYSILGLAAFIANSSNLLWIIKLLGGVYLIYLGIQGLRAKATLSSSELKPHSQSQIRPSKSLALGFACNLLNPKAPIYFVALFTSVLSPTMPWQQLVIYGVWIMCLQWLWFAFITHLLCHRFINQRMQRMGHHVERLFGLAMLILGIKVLRS